MAKLLSGQYDALKIEVLQAIRDKFCKIPTNEQIEELKNEIAEGIPEFNSLVSELYAQLAIIKTARAKAEELTVKIKDIGNKTHPEAYIHFRSILNREDVEQFLKGIARHTAFERGMTITLSYEGEKMISNAVYMAPTRNREMSEIRDAVIQDVSNKIEQNPDKYLDR